MDVCTKPKAEMVALENLLLRSEVAFAPFQPRRSPFVGSSQTRKVSSNIREFRSPPYERWLFVLSLHTLMLCTLLKSSLRTNASSSYLSMRNTTCFRLFTTTINRSARQYQQKLSNQ